MKKGDIVKCIHTDVYDLTLNKIYRINDIAASTQLLRICNDKGEYGFYYAWRFKIELRENKLKRILNEKR